MAVCVCVCVCVNAFKHNISWFYRGGMCFFSTLQMFTSVVIKVTSSKYAKNSTQHDEDDKLIVKQNLFITKYP